MPLTPPTARRPLRILLTSLLAVAGLAAAGPITDGVAVKRLGGAYQGPGDTVPPGDDDHDIGRCDMPFGLVCQAVDSCPEMDWLPHAPRCTLPALQASDPDPVWARLYTLSIREVIEGLRSGATCQDEFGNITTCLQTPFPVSEIHVFQSGWINGYNAQAAIQDDVPATVCVGGEVLSIGWAFDELVRAESCDMTEVCITFSAECMTSALLDWAMSDISPGEWADSWLFAVDFVSCASCESDPVDPFPVE